MVIQEQKIVTLSDENDVDQDFLVERLFKVNQKEYAVLIPVDEQGQQADDPYLFIHSVQDGESLLLPIEDDDEWECAADYYNSEIKK